MHPPTLAPTRFRSRSRLNRETQLRPLVNDVHSRLNPTAVERIIEVRSVGNARDAILEARLKSASLCIAGGGHSMGGQQYADGATMLSTTRYNRVLEFDRTRGLIEVEAGMQWPELIEYLWREQASDQSPWTIRQKQTGADHFSIGGAVSSNVHGRGLTMRPFVGDIEAITVLDTDGCLWRCSRKERPELFRLVVGGYGLFGFVVSVVLRLARRHKLRREVDVITVDRLMEAFSERIHAGCTFGDFQFAIDPEQPSFLNTGVFATYRPVDDETPIPEGQRALSPDDWRRLLLLAHTDKSAAFDCYRDHYRSTSGQVYWSDLHQLGTYFDGYHTSIDRATGAEYTASEVIGEVYVPRERLADFMAAAATDFRRHAVNVIYGTVRLIERDDETFLPWARDRYACVVFNLHTEHHPAGRLHTSDAFRRLIDLTIARGGSYYLTYHRDARRDQLLSCYPQFPAFLRLKREYDPCGVFQSDWYRHNAGLVGCVGDR